jgi:hypothetical protein
MRGHRLDAGQDGCRPDLSIRRAIKTVRRASGKARGGAERGAGMRPGSVLAGDAGYRDAGAAPGPFQSTQ